MATTKQARRVREPRTSVRKRDGMVLEHVSVLVPASLARRFKCRARESNKLFSSALVEMMERELGVDQ